MLVEQPGQALDIALASRFDDLTLEGEGIEMRFQRAPAGEAVLFRDRELCVRQLGFGFSRRNSAKRDLACFRSHSRLGLSGSCEADS